MRGREEGKGIGLGWISQFDGNTGKGPKGIGCIVRCLFVLSRNWLTMALVVDQIKLPLPSHSARNT